MKDWIGNSIARIGLKEDIKMLLTKGVSESHVHFAMGLRLGQAGVLDKDVQETQKLLQAYFDLFQEAIEEWEATKGKYEI